MESREKPSYKTEAEVPSTAFRWRHYAAWALVIAAGCIALGSAYMLGRSQASGPTGVEIVLPTPSPLKVQVTGAVNAPGLVEVRRGDRIADALQAAGGATRDAALDDLNLAAFATDGMHIRVLRQSTHSGTSAVAPADNEAPTASDTASNQEPAGSSVQNYGPLNINTATAEQLETLPNIGPARASAIISYRNSQGAFTSVDELTKISGIGSATVDQIRPLVTAQ